MLLIVPAAALCAFDFTYFEDELFDAWRARFLVGDAAAGQFSLLPASQHNQTSLYGATDMVYALHAVGMLNLSLSCADRARWARTIKSFQDNSSGFPLLESWEHMHTANPPYANYSWHAAGAAIETLQLLGSTGIETNCDPSSFVLPLPFQPVGKLINQGPNAWEAFMQHWLTKYDDVWMGSQAVQSLAAVVKLARLPASASGRTSEFFSWLFSFLTLTVSNTTGMWDGSPHQNAKHQLGGAFHIQHVYECFIEKEFSWPNARAAVDTTLAAQDATVSGTGTWGSKGEWDQREQWGAISSCIDLDGVYSAARGAIAAGGGAAPFYRWRDVQAACEAYLRTAEYILNNRTLVLGSAYYGRDTHLLHGPLYAVAECQLHFPSLVKTRRPWRRWASNASCIYA